MKFIVKASWRESRLVIVEASSATEARAKVRAGDWDDSDDPTYGPVSAGKATQVEA